MGYCKAINLSMQIPPFDLKVFFVMVNNKFKNYSAGGIMKTLSYLIVSFLSTATITAISPYDQIAYYERELASLEETMFRIEQQIACNIQNNCYSDYPIKRAQEIIARLGLREFNTSINPFTHIGRYMDQNADTNKKHPDRKKQKKLRQELCDIITEKELRPYRTQHREIKQQLRQAVVRKELFALQQKNGYELTNQDLKQLKMLKRLVDSSYRQELTRKINDYDNQISHLRSEINSLRSMREAALSFHHSSCMVCMTCQKKSHTCHICHTCVDHCCCTYQVATGVLALIADISAQASIDTLKQRMHSIETMRNHVQHKVTKLERAEQAIWDNYLKNKLNHYQMNAANYGCTIPMHEYHRASNPDLINYQITLLQGELGYAPARQQHSDNGAAFVGLGCAALAGAGLIAICYGANS